LSKTFTNDTIMTLINKDFIAIKFNFEKENEKNETYNFNGKQYTTKEIIGLLLNAKKGTPVELGIPLTVLLDITTNNSEPSMGFKTPSDLSQLLQKYIKES